MSINKKIACTLSLALLLLAIAIPMAGSVFAAGPQTEDHSYYHEQYTSNPESSFGAASLKGEWARFTTIEAGTMEEQMKEVIDFLAETYGQAGERFIVKEGIAEAQITNMAAPQYLYTNSDLYRELVTGDSVTVATGGTFSMLTDQNTQYERYAFYLEEAATFTLDTRFSLTEGKLALWVISPSGEVLHHIDASASYDQTVSLDLSNGLHAVVLEYHADNNNVSGTKTISGTAKR